MKLKSLALLATLSFSAPALAESITVTTFIRDAELRVKATMLDVMLMSETDIEIDGKKAEWTSPFMLRCTDKGDHYVMLSIGSSDDPWASIADDIGGTASVRAYGPPMLEIPSASFSSTKAGEHRLFYITLGNDAPEIARSWYSSGAVRFALTSSNGLPNLNFMVSGPMVGPDVPEKFAKTIALCQTLAR